MNVNLKFDGEIKLLVVWGRSEGGRWDGVAVGECMSIVILPHLNVKMHS